MPPTSRTPPWVAAAALVPPADPARAAFVQAFLVKCAAAGVTDPADIAAAAEAVAKRANVGTAAGGILGGATTLAAYGPPIGLAVPVIGGAMLGSLAAVARNQADRDDIKTMRLAAVANAYRRRAAEARTDAEVRRVVERDPSKYVVLG